MNNRWNRFVYRLWSPVYDAVLERMFAPGRRRAWELVGILPGERVGLIGVGTGSDLPLIPEGASVVGVDLSPAMLERARRKASSLSRDATLLEADAQALPFGASSFDVIVLNLVLSVVPDPRRCMAEALRVLRPGGRVVVFDKFLPDRERPTSPRRLANFATKAFGTDINRCLGPIIAGFPCRVVRDEPSILRGMYRVILIRPSEPLKPET